MLRNIHFCRANAAQTGRSLILTDGDILHQQSNGNVKWTHFWVNKTSYNYITTLYINHLIQTSFWPHVPGVFAPEIGQFYTDITNIALTPPPPPQPDTRLLILGCANTRLDKKYFPKLFPSDLLLFFMLIYFQKMLVAPWDQNGILIK